MSRDLAGGSVFAANAGTFEVGTDGQLTRVQCFDDPLFTAESACTGASSLLPRLTVNSAGGFMLTSTDPADVWSERTFAFRAGNGDVMLVSLSPNGDVLFGARYRTLGMPAIGSVTTTWNVVTTAQNLASPTLSATRNEILTVDGATGVFTRASTTVGDTNTHAQTLTRNAPRPGYTRRAAATNVPTASGGTTSVREFMALNLRGTGLTAVAQSNTATAPSNNGSLVLSVDQQ